MVANMEREGLRSKKAKGNRLLTSSLSSESVRHRVQEI